MTGKSTKPLKTGLSNENISIDGSRRPPDLLGSTGEKLFDRTMFCVVVDFRSVHLSLLFSFYVLDDGSGGATIDSQVRDWLEAQVGDTYKHYESRLRTPGRLVYAPDIIQNNHASFDEYTYCANMEATRNLLSFFITYFLPNNSMLNPWPPSSITTNFHQGSTPCSGAATSEQKTSIQVFKPGSGPGTGITTKRS